MALDAGVGVGVEAGGGACGFAVVDDLDGALWRRVGVVAQGDELPDEDGVDLVESAVAGSRYGLSSRGVWPRRGRGCRGRGRGSG